MNNLYVIIIILVFIAIIIKLYNDKSKLKSNLKNHNNFNPEQNKSYSSYDDVSIVDRNMKSNYPSKNSFLYGADDFGEMKKGVEIDGNTYDCEEDKMEGFEIQSAPKKRGRKKN